MAKCNQLTPLPFKGLNTILTNHHRTPAVIHFSREIIFVLLCQQRRRMCPTVYSCAVKTPDVGRRYCHHRLWVYRWSTDTCRCKTGRGHHSVPQLGRAGGSFKYVRDANTSATTTERNCDRRAAVGRTGGSSWRAGVLRTCYTALQRANVARMRRLTAWNALSPSLPAAAAAAAMCCTFCAPL